MSRILFEHVKKVYDDEFVAISDFNLEIQDGEFLTLVGPSGSGKSTLLRMVAGLEDISGGEIQIGETVVNRLPPRERDIAMVFQNYALYPHLSVRENMAFGLKRSTNLSNDEIDERVVEAAELMGIERLLDQKPKQLSGGQQQRVATGRAIVRNPAVFLFDEPLSNLDAKLRKHMRTELQRLQQSLDTTSIYVTHDQEEAMSMSDRIVILKEGELQQVGAPREVYTQPTNIFVAQFIGSPSMNMFVADLDRSGKTPHLLGGDIDVSISAARADAIAERNTSDSVLLGARPEHITVHEEQVRDSVPVFVELIEPIGSNDLLYFELDDSIDVENVVADSVDIGDSNEEDDEDEHQAFIAPGSISSKYENSNTPVYLTFNTDHIHVFDPQTGENLDVQPKKPASDAKTESAAKSD